MTMQVLCQNCQQTFEFTLPVPPKGSPPPLPSDRTQLSLTCTHCQTPMSLRFKTTDIVAVAEAASASDN